MKRLLSSAALGFVVVVLFLGARIAAQDKTGKTESAKSATGKTDGQGQLDADRFIKQHDKNNDGKLSREELPARLRGAFDSIDRDNDGKLSKEELQQHGLRMFRRMHPESVTFVWIIDAEAQEPSLQDLQNVYATLRKIDVNQDGKLTKAEIQTARKELCEHRVDAIFKEADKDNDKKISKKEAEGVIGVPFEGLDHDNDGYLTREELRDCLMRSMTGDPEGARAGNTQKTQK